MNLYNPEQGTSTEAVDMQKVIMLPRMPGVKRCVFSKRIVAFNMTVAPLGGKKSGKPLAIIWHEALRGRYDKDIASTHVKFVKYF